MNKSLLKNLFENIYRYRARLAIACVMVIISNGLLIADPLLFRQALITLNSSQPSAFWTHWLGAYAHSIFGWALLLLLVAAISAILKYYMRMIFIAVSREVELEVRAKLFEHIQHQSRAFFDRHEIGDLISRLTNDITAYRDVLGPGLMYPVFFLTIEIPAFIALFSLSVPLAWLSLIPVFLIYALHFLVRRPLFQVSDQVQDSLSEMSTMAHEHYSGIRIIKSYGIEDSTEQLFRRLCEHFSQVNRRLSNFQSLIFPVLNTITRVITVSLVLLTGAMILLGWSLLSTADFLSFMWIQSYIFGPLLMLGWILPIYQRGKAAYLRLVEIYEEKNEIKEEVHAIPHLPAKADIEIKHLTFTYPNQQTPALKNIQTHIKSGSFVGITGPVGSGKTTLLRLLNREYEVPKGKIFIGGQEIHHYQLSAFHHEMVTVEQLPFLFSKTIAANVRLGKQQASQIELEEAAKQVDLHESILEFPEQYETIIGERGVSLSGGQKQRMATARAFLVDRSILLLDDIFSAVDSRTEKRIFKAMKQNFQGKTVVLVTHRISILEQLDRIIYLANGQIVEEGTPHDLARHQGPYAALRELQRMHAL